MKHKWKKGQINALNESIAHWERMRDDKDCKEKPSVVFCACCEYDVRYADKDLCSACPVGIYTGQVDCYGTPYRNAVYEWKQRENGFKNIFNSAATKEIEFLKKVLAAGV